MIGTARTVFDARRHHRASSTAVNGGIIRRKPETGRRLEVGMEDDIFGLALKVRQVEEVIRIQRLVGNAHVGDRTAECTESLRRCADEEVLRAIGQPAIGKRHRRHIGIIHIDVRELAGR